MTVATEFTLRRLSDIAGAEITGGDLSQPLTPPLERAITDALLAHRIVVFRDQRLNAAQQHALTSRASFIPIDGAPATW
jgi:alpha-ketoglutarate-dependent taurine dioxygenase